MRNLNSQLEIARKEVKGLEQRKNFKQKISARIEVEKRNLRVLLAEADLGGERRALAARIVPSVKNMVKAVRLLLPMKRQELTRNKRVRCGLFYHLKGPNLQCAWQVSYIDCLL